MQIQAVSCKLLVALALLAGRAPLARAVEDPYEAYVRTSRDFQPVQQDPAWCLKAYPSWLFMPWTYQWRIGYDAAAGAFCKTTGINGAFIDRGDTRELDWINAHQLRFYMDHTAGKGDLHQWDHFPKELAGQIHGVGLRCRPVNAALQARLQGVIRANVSAVKSSPWRAAYALDDEISWGHFTHPCMWRVTDDAQAYASWLQSIYGPQAPQRSRWIGYNDIRGQLATWDVASFDASPLMDQWTFNDSYWNNFIGDLVTYANSVDPATPCGFVGAQCPSAFGGYDYAKLMRKVQYLEAYNLAGVQSIIRSFNPHNALPTVTTFFFTDPADAAWQAWYYLAQGNRGHIAWVENWFDGRTPKPWLAELAPTYRACGQTIGPLLSGATFKSDGVALYYSHASIQLGWILDAAAHGATWVNRNGDDRLGAAPRCRLAWTQMLRDEGLQFTWLSYVDLIQHGVPAGVRVLILPETLCLSDAEARRIKAFCLAGGSVVADYLPGLWDQHGRGRPAGGALDDLFGVRHNPGLTARDVFQGNGKLWSEVDQDAHFNDRKAADFMGHNTCLQDASGFNKAVRAMDVARVNTCGGGKATLLNLSPQWYLAQRAAGLTAAASRSVFMKPLHDAGLQRWVQLKDVSPRTFGYEITYWSKDGRTILFLVANRDIQATDAGGGAAIGLTSDTVSVTLTFAQAVANVRNERTGQDLGRGREFPLQWKMNEACVLSFDGN